MSQLFFQLLSRVHTFTITNWTYFETQLLNPYILSSKGYYVSSYLLLQCSVCHKTIQLSPQLQPHQFSEIVSQLSSHKQHCIYKQQNMISREQNNFNNNNKPFTKQEVYLLIDEIIQLVKPTYDLLKEKKEYPLINKEEVEKYVKIDMFTMKFISQAYKLNWANQIKITFFLLVFGWAIKKKIKQNQLNQHQNTQPYQLYCNFCGRQVNLNKFKSIHTQSQFISQNFPSQQTFDPISQHRYFCFWVNNLSFLNCTGYQIILQQIYDKINESKSLFSKRQPQQTKKIRVEVDKYLQNFQLKTSEQFSKIKNIFNQCENMRKSLENQDKNNNQFENVQKRMIQFVQNDIGNDIKGQIKKIKLN